MIESPGRSPMAVQIMRESTLRCRQMQSKHRLIYLNYCSQQPLISDSQYLSVASISMSYRDVDDPEPGILKINYHLPAWPSLNPYRTYKAAFIGGFDYGCGTIIHFIRNTQLDYALEMVDAIAAGVNKYRHHMKQDHFGSGPFNTSSDQQCAHPKLDLTGRVFQSPCYKGFHEGAIAAVTSIQFKNTAPEFEEDIREILKRLETGVHHEFVRLMELDGCGPERKEGFGSEVESQRRSEAREVVRMVCMMRFRR
jgi:hypothetical protein